MKLATILASIRYYDFFQYPLKVEEIQQYLIAEAISMPQLKKALAHLTARGKLDYYHGYYALSSCQEKVAWRLQKEKSTPLKLSRAKTAARFFGYLPWVKMVGITGSVAMNNANRKDDIDLLIITSPRRLWLSRALIVFFLRLFGWYRSDHKIEDMICANIWLSTDNLALNTNSPYVLHELAQLKPVYNQRLTYETFINSNQQLKSYFPNWQRHYCVNSPNQMNFKVFSFALDLIDLISFKCQLYHMKNKRTVEVVEYSRALFHPTNIKYQLDKSLGHIL